MEDKTKQKNQEKLPSQRNKLCACRQEEIFQDIKCSYLVRSEALILFLYKILTKFSKTSLVCMLVNWGGKCVEM